MSRKGHSRSEMKRNNEKRSSRRTMLKSAGGLAIAGIGGPMATRVRASPTEDVEITYSYSHKDVHNPEKGINEETKEVPKEWYSELTHARQVRSKKNFEKKPGVQSVSVLPGKYGGQSAKIRVGASEKTAEEADKHVDDILGSIPDWSEGVEIEKEEVGIGKSVTCYDSDYGNSVPGGAKVETGDGSAYGTLSGAVYYIGYGPRFATNYHIFNEYDDVAGKKMHHPESTNEAIGEIDIAGCGKDIVVAESINNHTASDEIAGTSLSVVGQYTKDGVDDLIAADKSATKNGVKSCETSGKVVASDGYIGYVDDGCGDRNYQVKGEWTTNPGDSGSAAYRDVGGGEAKVLSMNAGTDPLNGNTYGFGAYHLDDYFSIYWA